MHKKLAKKLSSHSWRSRTFMYHSSNVLTDITNFRFLTFQVWAIKFLEFLVNSTEGLEFCVTDLYEAKKKHGIGER